MNAFDELVDPLVRLLFVLAIDDGQVQVLEDFFAPGFGSSVLSTIVVLHKRRVKVSKRLYPERGPTYVKSGHQVDELAYFREERGRRMAGIPRCGRFGGMLMSLTRYQQG